MESGCSRHRITAPRPLSFDDSAHPAQSRHLDHMKNRILIFSFVLWLTTTFAFGSEDFANKLVGTWEHKEVHGDTALTGYSILAPDGSGASIAKMSKNSQTHWAIILFTWKVDDGKVLQTATKTNMSSVQVGTVTSDTIVSIDAEHYVYKSGKQTTTETRVKGPPAEFAKTLAAFMQKK